MSNGDEMQLIEIISKSGAVCWPLTAFDALTRGGMHVDF